MPELIHIGLGLVIGFVVGWLWFRSKSVGEKAILQEKARYSDTLKSELEEKRQKLSDLTAELAEVRTASEKDLAAAKEKIEFVTKAREELTKEFENLANKILEDKGNKLAGENRSKLEELLRPFKDQLGEFRKRVDHVYDKEGKERSSLLTEIRQLKELNNQISKEAVDLTQALKGQAKTRGNWGELVITRVLEASGLTAGREYESQLYLKEKHGCTQGRFPDFVVHLPESRDIVIDSKVALNDYEAYCSAEDDNARAKALKAHVEAVRRHMTDLSSKNYEELAGINPLEQVIMCVPNESAYITAVAEDPKLHEDAMKKGVLVVGPTTLVLTLKIISAMWRAEDQNKNAMDIANRGQLLYDKFVGFVEDLLAVDSALRSANKACEEARKKLSEGSGNLVGQAEKLRALGVKAKKQLPPEIADGGTEDTLPLDPPSLGSYGGASHAD